MIKIKSTKSNIIFLECKFLLITYIHLEILVKKVEHS